jgi:hypothetical protein
LEIAPIRQSRMFNFAQVGQISAAPIASAPVVAR